MKYAIVQRMSLVKLYVNMFIYFVYPTDICVCIYIYFDCLVVCLIACCSSLEQEYLLNYLQTWEDDAKISESAMEQANRAVIAVIKNEKINTRNVKQLTSYRVIKQMREVSKYDNVCELLSVVYSGSVSEYNKYASANGKYIESIGIDSDQLLHKMRILALCSLGQNTKSISFNKLSKELMIETEIEIETIVIDGIKRGLISAKIDHKNQQVVIKLSNIFFLTLLSFVFARYILLSEIILIGLFYVLFFFFFGLVCFFILLNG